MFDWSLLIDVDGYPRWLMDPRPWRSLNHRRGATLNDETDSMEMNVTDPATNARATSRTIDALYAKQHHGCGDHRDWDRASSDDVLNRADDRARNPKIVRCSSSTGLAVTWCASTNSRTDPRGRCDGSFGSPNGSERWADRLADVHWPGGGATTTGTVADPARSVPTLERNSRSRNESRREPTTRAHALRSVVS